MIVAGDLPSIRVGARGVAFLAQLCREVVEVAVRDVSLEALSYARSYGIRKRDGMVAGR